MSYVYYPPRTTNFFPSGPPYLSGLLGLGDYEADLAAYQIAYAKYKTDLARWYGEKTTYTAARTAWDSKIKKISLDYTKKLIAYAKDKKAWDSEAQTYAVALNAWGRGFSEAKAANTEKAKQIATTFKLSLPQSFFDFGACISADDKAYWQKNCTVVKGLGIVSYGDACGMMRLPVCAFGDKPTLRQQPTPPADPVYPKKPTLRAQPIAPTAPTAPVPVVTTPVLIPTPSSPSVPSPSLPTPTPEETTIPEEEPKRANVLMGGLIVVAVLGGGYLVWRTLKKPKAQAA